VSAGRPRRRGPRARVAGLLLLLVLTLAPAADAEPGAGAPGAEGAAASGPVADPAPSAEEPAAPGPVADPPSSAEAIGPPTRRHGATIARVVAASRARRRLDEPSPHDPLVATTTSWSRQPQALLVLARATREGREWLRVALPFRPVGSGGWIPRDRASLTRTRWWIDVWLRDRTVTVRHRGRVRRRFRAVIGAPGTPTPPGLFALWERNRQASPGGFVGSWVLSLTALSPVLEDFGGGPGRIGLHGRGGASLLDPLGSARSHGCIRLSNAAIRWLALRVPVGTPVRILR